MNDRLLDLMHDSAWWLLDTTEVIAPRFGFFLSGLFLATLAITVDRDAGRIEAFHMIAIILPAIAGEGVALLIRWIDRLIVARLVNQFTGNL